MYIHSGAREHREEYSKQSGGKVPENDSLELRLKLGEAIVLAARDCGELLPHYADTLLPAVLSNARDPHPLIRASALSNLAEICQLLGHSFGHNHHEVYSVAICSHYSSMTRVGAILNIFSIILCVL